MKTKEDFVEILKEALESAGVSLSKDKTWKVFKVAVNSIVEAALTDEKDNALVLSGIGRFEIIKASPRQSKIGVVDFVPKIRWRASSRVDELLQTRMGQVPDPEKLKASKEALAAAAVAAGRPVSNLPPRTPAEKKPEEKKPAEKKPAEKAPKKDTKKDADAFEDEF